MIDRFWAITVFFNPARYGNKLENFRRFRAASRKQGLQLLVVELAFGDASFEIEKNDAEILVQLRAGENSIMWQKERLLNIGLQNLPADCDKLAWVDGDLIFDNHYWVQETVERLENFPIVQPFETAIRPNRSKPNDVFQSYPKAYAVGKLGCLGYAWAARREVFSGCGFYDKFIMGGGDKFMVDAFYGLSNSYMPQGIIEDASKWKATVHKMVSGKVSYVSGTVSHLWHGENKNRLYQIRYRILDSEAFTESDIRVSEVGVWEWATNKPKLHEWARNYFKVRREDHSPKSNGKQPLFLP